MEPAIQKKLLGFFGRGPLLTFQKGDVIIRADEEKPPYIYYIESGYVRQFAYSKTGDEATVIIYKAPTYFPIVFAMLDFPNHYTFDAMTTTKVRKMPRGEVLKFITNDSALLYEMTCRLGKWMFELLDMLENLMFSCAQTRILLTLFNYGRQCGERKDGKITMKIPLTHKDISSMVGLSRETVSREIEKLKKRGVISQNENDEYIITNLEKVQETKLI